MFLSSANMAEIGQTIYNSYTQKHKAPTLLLEGNISKWLTHLKVELIFSFQSINGKKIKHCLYFYTNTFLYICFDKLNTKD